MYTGSFVKSLILHVNVLSYLNTTGYFSITFTTKSWLDSFCDNSVVKNGSTAIIFTLHSSPLKSVFTSNVGSVSVFIISKSRSE